MGAAVEGDGAAEAVRLFVDGPVEVGADVTVEAGGGEDGALHSEVLDDAPQLLDRGLHMLAGQKAHAPEAGAARHVGLVEPVVVGPGCGDGPVDADDAPVGEGEGGVEDCGVDVGVGEEVEPLVGADVAGAAGEFAGGCDLVMLVQVVEGGEDALDVDGPLVVGSGNELGDAIEIFEYVAVAVDDADS